MIEKETLQVEETNFHIPADSVNFDDRTRVLNHYDTFGIFDRWGDIHPHAKKALGIFYQGTRFINRLELKLNSEKPLLLSSAIKEDNDILSVDLTNPDLGVCDIPENSLHISRSIIVRNGLFYDQVRLVNYSEKTCHFNLTIAFGADFRDIFEVRGIARKLQPNKAEIITGKNKIIFHHLGQDKYHRTTEVVFKNEEDCVIHGHHASFEFHMAPHDERIIDYAIHFRSDEKFLAISDDDPGTHSLKEIEQLIRKDILKSRSLFATIKTSNDQFNHWLNRSLSDLLSLLTQTPNGKYPYAGVPWYNTAFGRDGIITAMEVLWIAPAIAREVLFFLAERQATELIPEKDAEPGKILHETRTGEMANTGEIPFKEYYGTIDATPLFIMLAGMYYERTNDLESIRKIWSNIKRALQWIDNYGDLDGDGFVEYKHKSENGLTNQGWKDSYDSIMYENGQLCKPPIALSEVQGYVFAAKKYAARLADAFGDTDLAKELLHQSREIKKKFNDAFWDEQMGCYVIALDGDKKPCRVISSNPGHCLFTKIVDKDKAAKLVEALTSPEMFSGWGIRTLSSREKLYNPMSYHNGSIWPHDNAIIAYGFSEYDYQDESIKILHALFDSSLFIELQRLPELFCGFERRKSEGPTAYPVACSPQAWSVAAVFLLLQACLKIEINALTKTLIFNKPALPDFLQKISISKLQLGEDSCDFELFRYPADVGIHVTHKPDDWELIIKK
jgi:glycogen debranching enzyme